MFLHVKAIRTVRPYEIVVEFDNGVTKQVDLSKELYGEVFEPLKDPELFRQVRIDEETMTIQWPNGADFAPEFLYEIGVDVKQVA